MHLVRNAVDHAIEPPDERRAAEARGRHAHDLLFERSSTQLELTVADDGAGVDPERVAERAGAPVPESDGALLELLCEARALHRAEATHTSGRGMGMDIVKRVAVDELSGEVQMRTRRGHGTAFTLRVPLTISIVDPFSFEAGGQRFVVPVAMVEEILELDRSRGVRGPSANGREGVSLFERRGKWCRCSTCRTSSPCRETPGRRRRRCSSAAAVSRSRSRWTACSGSRRWSCGRSRILS